jgi:hypothetical protein
MHTSRCALHSARLHMRNALSRLFRTERRGGQNGNEKKPRFVYVITPIAHVVRVLAERSFRAGPTLHSGWLWYGGEVSPTLAKRGDYGSSISSGG